MPYKDPAIAKIKAREAHERFRKRRTEARISAYNERVRCRVSPSRDLCLWAAGHFEGEGTVTLTKAGHLCVSRPLVCLASTDREVIDLFSSNWPSHVRTYRPNSKNGLAKPAHYWALNSREKIECFLRDLRPHLRTQRVLQKFDLLLCDIEDRLRSEQTEDWRQRQRDRLAQMRTLNQRGLGATVMPGTSVTFAEAAREKMTLAYADGSPTPLLPFLGKP